MIDQEKIKIAIRDLLIAVGEDPDREGLRETPDRIARMYSEILAGIETNPLELAKIFTEKQHNEMIIVKDITFYSMCEHHLLPFFGKAHVIYKPQNNKILGLSKVARIVDVVAKKLQLQERLGTEIADIIMESIDPLGVIVVLEAEHLCMAMRGIKKQGSKTITISDRGIFKDNIEMKKEALSLIRM